MRKVNRTAVFIALTTSIAFAGCESTGGDSLPDNPTLDQLSRDPDAIERLPDDPLEAGQTIDVGDAPGSVYGNEDAENDEYSRVFLRDVALPGDLDGDGIDDVVLTGALFTHTEDVSCDVGCDDPLARLFVDVHYGGTALRNGSGQRTDVRITTPHVARNYTGLVRAIGDVDGDGKRDLLIGARSEGCEQGDVYLVYGGPRLAGNVDVRDVGVLIRERSTDCLRFGVPGALGDIDGDGLDDFAIGAPASPESGRAGAIYVYYGSRTRLSGRVSEENAAGRLEANDLTNDETLTFTHPVGDLDGDGHDEFVVSTHRNVLGQVALGRSWGESGTSFLVWGSASRLDGLRSIADEHTRLPESLISIAGLGDLDDDGRGELGFVLGDAAGPIEGVAHVVYGRAMRPEQVTVNDADARTPVRRGDGHSAFSIVPGGDFNGDGWLDVFYGDPSYRDVEGVSRGAVHVLLGSPSRLSASVDLEQSVRIVGRGSGFSEGDRAGRFIGSSIAGGSDIDGDGIDDAVIVRRTEPRGGIAYFWFGVEAE